MMITTTCLLALVLCLGGLSRGLDLDHVELILGLDEFRDIDEVVIIPDESDETLADLISPSWPHMNRTGFALSQLCSEGSSRKWLAFDLNDKSALLTKASADDLGTCIWIFKRTLENLDQLERIKPVYNSRVYLIDDNPNSGEDQSKHNLSLSELYFIGHFPSFEEHKLVLIQDGSLTDSAISDSIWHRRRNLKGILITMTVFNTPPGLYVIPGRPELTVGFQIDLVRELQQIFNFTYRLIEPTEGSYGIMDQNGTWNGMMRQLIEHEADISLILQISEQRSKLVDFYHVLSQTGLSLVTKKANIATSFSFISLLRIPVWIASGLTILAFFAIGLIFSGTKGQRQPVTYVLTLYGSMVNQATDELSKTMSMRILLMTVLVFGFLGINFLSANLTSSISVRREVDLINGLEDVIANDYQLFIFGGTSIEFDFATARPGTHEHQLWQDQLMRNPDQRPKDYKVAITNFLASEKGALIIYRDMVKGWTYQNRDIGCQLKLKNLDKGNLLLTLASWKGFPFYEAFNSIIAKSYEIGLRHKWSSSWLEPLVMDHDYVCSPSLAEADIAIGLDGTRFFFFLFMVGMAFGVMVAFGERLKRPIQPKQSKANRPPRTSLRNKGRRIRTNMNFGLMNVY